MINPSLHLGDLGRTLLPIEKVLKSLCIGIIIHSLVMPTWAHSALETSFHLGAANFPSHLSATRLEASVVDATGQQWDLSRDLTNQALTPGLDLGLRFTSGFLTASLQGTVAFVSFGNEKNKTGSLYGATLALPLGVRTTKGSFELSAFAGPAIVFGGFGLGTLARQNGAPIDFGSVRFFDDETAVHMVDISFAGLLGLETSMQLGKSLSAFVQLSEQFVLSSSRSFNLAGYTDEAQSTVEWSARSLDDPAIMATVDGQSLGDRTKLSFSGLRLVLGLTYHLR